jgi:exopolysaccharide production protein ExoZ
MFKSIQACRGLAALLVVLHHLGDAMASGKYFGATSFAVPFVAGDAGVEFFFVLSGFIITWVHFDDFGKPANVLRYLRRRAVRIYPAYWIVFSIVYLFAQASPSLRSAMPHDYPTILKSLGLMPQDSFTVGAGSAPVIVVAWTLQYEVCFYLLIALFIVSRLVGVLVCISLLANAGACQVRQCSFPRSFLAENLILLFGLGALIACCRKRSMHIKGPVAVATLSGLAFLSYGAFEAVTGTGALPIDRRLIYGVLSGVVIFALVQSENDGHLRINSRWVSFLGESSYSLYLIHYPLISALCKFMIYVGLAGRPGAIVAYPFILGACICASVGFHLRVERPILRALSR